MAQKRGFNLLVLRHYDKAISVVVLLALLVSLIVLTDSVVQRKEQKSKYEQNVLSMKAKVDHLDPQSTAPYDTALQNLHHPETVSPSANDAGLFVPQRRVWCVVCMKPIPIAATNCPFCGSEQHGTVVSDSEGKGIPDKWRLKYFNHPDARAEDHSRAEDDADGDGFSNLQEYLAGTDPRDPKDHPDLIALIRCKEVTSKPYRFVFTGASKMPGGKLQLTFNMKGADHTYFVKQGEEIEKTGLFYSNCVQKTEIVQDPRVGPTPVTRNEVQLFRPADGKTFVLKENDPHATMEQEVVFTLRSGDKTTEYHVSVDGTLELDGQKYRLAVNMSVDEKPVSVAQH